MRPLCENPLRLKRCDLAQCEAMCCYDGAYLEPGEEEVLQAVIAENPAWFAFLPAVPVVDGNWRGLVKGLKTKVVPHRYQNPEYPAHFEQTRCTFALDDGRCSLQVLAEQQGLHPWTYKPRVCWLHPLGEGRNGPIPPPLDPADDPLRMDESYPGYVCFTACGRHRTDGAPWREVLAEEVRYHFGRYISHIII